MLTEEAAEISEILKTKLEITETTDFNDFNLYGGMHGIILSLAACQSLDFNVKLDQKLLSHLLSQKPTLKKNPMSIIDGNTGEAYWRILIGRFLPEYKLIAHQSAKVFLADSFHSTLEEHNVIDTFYGLPAWLLTAAAYIKSSNDIELIGMLRSTLDKLINSTLSLISASLTDRSLIRAGISHGLSGVAVAMIHSASIIGQDITDLLNLIFEAENLVKSDQDQHLWLDTRFTIDKRILTNAWCNGVAGIGLSRLEAIKYGYKSNLIVDDALECIRYVTRNPASSTVDNFCCGSFGRLELLVTASSILGNEKLLIFSQKIAEKIIHRKQFSKGYKKSSNEVIDFPGFFQGLSGILYQILRITHQKKIPSIALFES